MENINGGDSSVNIIGQLVQMSGEPPKQIVEAKVEETPELDILEVEALTG